MYNVGGWCRHHLLYFMFCSILSGLQLLALLQSILRLFSSALCLLFTIHLFFLFFFQQDSFGVLNPSDMISFLLPRITLVESLVCKYKLH